MDGFYIINIYYSDTHPLYIEQKNWGILDKTKLVGEREELCQGKNDNKNGGILYGLFLAPKINNRLTIDKHSIIQEHKTPKGFND